MTAEGGAPHAEPPHEPAEPEPRRFLPESSMLVRGLGLSALAVAGLAGAVGLVQKGGWLLSPVAAVLGGASVLAAWAAAVHLTGGEKFDDHPWV